MENHHHCAQCGDMCPPSQNYCYRHRNLANKTNNLISPALEKALLGWMEKREPKQALDFLKQNTSLEEDTKMVAAQTGCSIYDARIALLENKGDITKAMIQIQGGREKSECLEESNSET